MKLTRAQRDAMQRSLEEKLAASTPAAAPSLLSAINPAGIVAAPYAFYTFPTGSRPDAVTEVPEVVAPAAIDAKGQQYHDLLVNLVVHGKLLADSLDSVHSPYDEAQVKTDWAQFRSDFLVAFSDVAPDELRSIEQFEVLMNPKSILSQTDDLEQFPAGALVGELCGHVAFALEYARNADANSVAKTAAENADALATSAVALFEQGASNASAANLASAAVQLGLAANTMSTSTLFPNCQNQALGTANRLVGVSGEVQKGEPPDTAAVGNARSACGNIRASTSSSHSSPRPGLQVHRSSDVASYARTHRMIRLPTPGIFRTDLETLQNAPMTVETLTSFDRDFELAQVVRGYLQATRQPDGVKVVDVEYKVKSRSRSRMGTLILTPSGFKISDQESRSLHDLKDLNTIKNAPNMDKVVNALSARNADLKTQYSWRKLPRDSRFLFQIPEPEYKPKPIHRVYHCT